MRSQRNEKERAGEEMEKAIQISVRTNNLQVGITAGDVGIFWQRNSSCKLARHWKLISGMIVDV